MRFLASYPKSGNTWVRAFVEAYVTGKVNINGMLTTASDQDVRVYQPHSPVPFDILNHEQWVVIRPAALHSMQFSQSGTFPRIVKTHNANVAYEGVPLFPKPLFDESVYLIRDPRKVVPSAAAHFGQSLDDSIHQLSEEGRGFKADREKGAMHGLMCSWPTHVRSWHGADKVMTVRFEDLKKDPHDVFKAIIEHYKIDCSEERIDYAIELCRLDRLQQQEKSEDGFREASQHCMFFGGERQKLSPEQVARIEEICGDVMKQHGYL